MNEIISIPCANVTKDEIKYSEHQFSSKEKIDGVDVTLYKKAEMLWMMGQSEPIHHFQTNKCIPISVSVFHFDKQKLENKAKQLQQFLKDINAKVS